MKRRLIALNLFLLHTSVLINQRSPTRYSTLNRNNLFHVTFENNGSRDKEGNWSIFRKPSLSNFLGDATRFSGSGRLKTERRIRGRTCKNLNLTEAPLIFLHILSQSSESIFACWGVMIILANTFAFGTPGRSRVKSIMNSAGECDMIARFGINPLGLFVTELDVNLLRKILFFWHCIS